MVYVNYSSTKLEKKLKPQPIGHGLQKSFVRLASASAEDRAVHNEGLDGLGSEDRAPLTGLT